MWTKLDLNNSKNCVPDVKDLSNLFAVFTRIKFTSRRCDRLITRQTICNSSRVLSWHSVTGLRCVHWRYWRRGILFHAAYINRAVLTSNTCGNVPEIHVDRQRRTSRGIKGYTDSSSFLTFPLCVFDSCKNVSQLLALSHLIMLHRQREENIWYLICCCESG